jgi:hypothetical protein
LTNPYLNEFTRLQTELAAPPDYVTNVHGQASRLDRRKWCVQRYAFAVPTSEALETISRYAPIVELGAGTGYWAWLLRQRGVDCLAYDLAPPDQVANPHAFRPLTWTTVEPGSVEVLQKHSGRALFLCWPPYRDPFAAQALTAYAGSTFIHIGEPRGGHTADDTFFDALEHAWQPVEHVALPNWPGTRDALTVFKRR